MGEHGAAERNVAKREEIELASRIACGDMLRELGDLARRAEKAGALPQGKRLAKAAKAIAKGNFEEAMRLRDEIKSDLESQRTDRHLLYAVVFGLVVVPVILGILSKLP